MGRIAGRKNTGRAFDVVKCKTKIKGILDKIIDNNMLQFRVSALENPLSVDFSIKGDTGYGYEKYNHFFLDRVEGHYDKSLFSLLHWILYQEKYYAKILTPEQLVECQSLFREDPAALYLPCVEGEVDLERLTIIDEIMSECVLYVGQKLISEGFTVSSGMLNLINEIDNN